jgi:predicted RND superfamily exporter protein
LKAVGSALASDFKQRPLYPASTQEAIIDQINKPNLISSLLGTPVNVTGYLGGTIQRDDQNIISAEATFLQWFGRVNMSLVTADDISSSGTGEVVDSNSLEWEELLKTILLADQASLPAGLESFVNVGRSYSDVAGETIVNDAIMMPIGFLIVFVYVVVMLGKFTCTEQRALLALGGLVCIGLTIGVMYGLCSAFGLFYGPMHNVIPFLLLGIGIDDMFVIMQCYDNLGQSGERTGDTVRDVGLTMRHAGVAITVTSFTDFIVFALGATTVLPALRSFCLWCSVGIVAVYFFQAS